MDILLEVLKKYPSEITEVVCGMAIGVDTLGKEWAESQNIPVQEFPADWDGYGKKAGMIRNKEMAAYADCAILIWDSKSRGTKNMLDIMTRLDKPVYLVIHELTTD